MRLYFIRHAQSADNLYVADNAGKGVKSHGLDQTYFNRQADPELSEVGLKQIRALGRYVAERKQDTMPDPGSPYPFHDDFDLTHIYASLMVRTMLTANAVAEALCIQPSVWEDIHETGGIWEPDLETGTPVGSSGKNRGYFEDRFPSFVLPDALGEKGWWSRPLETGLECKARAKRVVEELLNRHGGTGDRVAVVSHGLFYSFLMKEIMQVPSGKRVTFAMNNAAITRVDFVNGQAVTVYMNRTEHFPPGLIT